VAQLGPIDGVAQIPTSHTKSPKRVDCKNKMRNFPQTELLKMNSHFHFLFSWHLRQMTKFANCWFLSLQKIKLNHAGIVNIYFKKQHKKVTNKERIISAMLFLYFFTSVICLQIETFSDIFPKILGVDNTTKT
jgi:hypothetical protein